MKNITDTIQGGGGGGKTYSFLLAVTIALALVFSIGLAQTARADYWDWVGKGSGQTSYFDEHGNGKGTTGCWYHSVATSTDKFASDNHNFESAGSGGRPSFNSGWDKVVTFRKSSAMDGAVNIVYSAAPIVFVAEQPAYGLDGTGALKLSNSSTLQINSGTYSFGHLQIGITSGKTATLVVNGGTVKAVDTYTRIGTSGGSGVLTVKSGGSYDNTSAGNQNFTLGQDSGSSGTLNVQGGNVKVGGYVTLNYHSSAKESHVNVTDGGVLEVNQIYLNNQGTSGGTFTIDGGTLKAIGSNSDYFTRFLPAGSGFNVYIGANAATIDANGHDIVISASLQDKSGDAGAVQFMGASVITLTGTPSYTGGTTVEAGTVLSLTAAAKVALVANSVSVEIPEAGVADGTTVLEINDGNGAFTQAEVDAMAITGTGASRYGLALADNGTKVVIADTLAGEYVWNDGDSGASWRASGKWSKNDVAGDWYDSTAAAFENAGDAATVDSAVTAASVEFRANATVTGTAALTVPSVTVASGVSASISVPVAGPLEKSGAGTLTLSQSRTGVATVLSEGTLAMSGTASLDWSQFTFGTDAEKPVALHMGANATIANIPQNWRVGNVEGLTSTFVKDGGDLTVGNIYLSDKMGAETSFAHNGGLLSVGGCIDIGSLSEAHFEIAGGMVTNTTNYIHMSPNGSPADMTVRTGAKYGMSANSLGIIVSGRSHGTLNVSGGDVFANGPLNLCYRGGDATVNVTDGGILAFDKVQYNGGDESDPKGGTAVISIDGGTIRANASDDAFIPGENNLTVTVGANGGTLDANGKNVTVAKAIGGTGGMTYKGGGTVVLSAMPTYSGVTTVEVGTTLSVPSPIDGAVLAFTVPDRLSSGLCKVVETTGADAFADNILSVAALPEPANARFFLSEDKKTIWCIYSNAGDQHVWIGGASGSLNVAANWLPETVPTSGTAVIGNFAEAALTNPEGSAFAATTIIVPDGSAPVTISGAKFSGMSKITNNSSSMIEFENAVEFSGNVDVLQNTGIVKFTGGATGTWLARAMDLHGTYTFTGTGDRIELAGTTVKSDGVYNLPNATFYKHNGDFHIEAGGRAEVKDAKIASKDADKHLLGTLNGEFKVNGEFYVTAPDSKGVTHYTCSAGSGTLIANRIRVAQNGYIVTPSKTIMGPNGIIRGTGYVRVYNSGSHEFGSYADWTMYYDHYNNTATEYFVIYKHSSSGSWSDVTFDTTDYYDSTVGRTITSEAPIGAADAASAAKFRVTVKGKGRFVFANTSDYNIFSGGLTVNDSATIEAKANAWPGKGAVTLNGTSTLLLHTGGAARTGAITLNGGTTLEVAETSGTASLGGALTLNQGSKLKFKLGDENNATLALTALTLNATAENKALVEFASGSVKSFGRSYTLTSGGKFSEGDEAKFALPEGDGGKLTIVEGNLVYTAPKYFIIKVK